MTNTFHPCRSTTTQNTHTWTAVPALFTSSLHIRQLKTMLWLRETMTDSVRSWQAQTHSLKTAVPAHTHMLSVWNVRIMNGVQPRARARGQTPGDAARSQLSPVSHITALCGKPHFHHTLRHPADHSSIYDHMEGEEPYRDIGCVCWPEKQNSGFWDYSGKEEKERNRNTTG